MHLSHPQTEMMVARQYRRDMAAEVAGHQADAEVRRQRLLAVVETLRSRLRLGRSRVAAPTRARARLADAR